MRPDANDSGLSTSPGEPHRREAIQTIYLGGGCFWCMDAVFRRIRGVLRVRCGYMGGHIIQPSYRQVCSGTTGHAEVVEVIFDEEALALSALLEVFFAAHDPTTLNRQGADVGTQYRSVVFCSSAEQRQAVERFINDLEQCRTFDRPVVTQLADAGPFYPAEDYHQNYYDGNLYAPYCQYVILPKLEKINKQFPGLLVNAKNT
ncbi:MAG: peptide-methionine (S)-S-oxide reductase MsrA [Chitinophagales bacterium]|nr:peptide-methionine (S)-S-oxide reductase MsrA [Chitinophagales bacterium]MDW8393372.1 peptide-methionine (S)-S-oxide reductase MsrA [Chitinophagales bacterium]